MSVIKGEILQNAYRDSVFLMKISSQLGDLEGIEAVSAMMATERNKELFKNAGLFTPELARAKADDLAVMVRGKEERLLSGALQEARKLLSSAGKSTEKAEEQQAGRLEQALAEDESYNLALISVAGDYARYEAAKAISRGLNVMLYSDNISLEDERRLKEAAGRKGVLVMGPDCGTALINGIPLAFANRVRSGPIGLVGASGTGLQEVSSLIHNLGSGISQAVGTGGRDLKDSIGGLTVLRALAYLEQDVKTRIIVLISKPPGAIVRGKICDFVRNCSKPVVVSYTGCADYAPEKEAGAFTADSLEEAALTALNLGKEEGQENYSLTDEAAYAGILAKAARDVKKGRFLRGIFGGGSLCYEAMHVLQPFLGDGEMYSNTPLPGVKPLDDVWQSRAHTCLDMGDDEFTVGKPHPMIDPQEKNKRLLQEIKDPETAVILFDLVIGYGSHPDPAGEIVKAIAKAKESGGETGVCLIASVCGTEEDTPQKSGQIEKLRSAGVMIMPSNAQAAKLAGDVVLKITARAGR